MIEASVKILDGCLWLRFPAAGCTMDSFMLVGTYKGKYVAGVASSVHQHPKKEAAATITLHSQPPTDHQLSFSFSQCQVTHHGQRSESRNNSA
jgi:uncharacterized protein (DUF305 family)